MPKTAVQHACSECGYATGKWLGRCPECGSWGTLVEERVENGAPRAGDANARPLLRLVDVETADAARLATGVSRPRERRPRNRQVDFVAHGASGHVEGAQGRPRLGRGVGGPGQAPCRP